MRSSFSSLYFLYESLISSQHRDSHPDRLVPQLLYWVLWCSLLGSVIVAPAGSCPPAVVCAAGSLQIAPVLPRPKMNLAPLTLQPRETKRRALGLALLQVIAVKEINHISFLAVLEGRGGLGGKRRKFNTDISHLVLFLLMEISQKPK